MVAAKGAVRDLEVRDALGAHLVGGLPERQRLGLREAVRHQQIVVVVDVVDRPAEADEVGRDQLRSLVDELVVRVLAVRFRAVPQTIGPVW